MVISNRGLLKELLDSVRASKTEVLWEFFEVLRELDEDLWYKDFIRSNVWSEVFLSKSEHIANTITHREMASFCDKVSFSKSMAIKIRLS